MNNDLTFWMNLDNKSIGDKRIKTDFIIHSLFEKCAKKNPNAIAVVFGNQALTYEELNQKANQLANYLRKFNLKPDTLIAIAMPRSLDLFIAILGILKAGCAYLPLDDTQPVERLLYLLADSKTPILITQSKSSPMFSQFSGKQILFDKIAAEINVAPRLNTFINSDNLAYVIYTSGTTGKPKGVLIEHHSLVNYVQWFKQYSEISAGERIDFSSNIVFDMAITTSIAALALNLQIIICSETVKRNIRLYLEYLVKHKINIIKVTPSYFKLMIEEVKKHSIELPDLKTIILGGEYLLTTDCAEWLKIFPHQTLFNEYGPTETTVGVTQCKVTSDNIRLFGKSIPIGKPGLNMECILLDDREQPVEQGELGELYIGGKCVARAYLNIASKQFTQLKHSTERWYKTGDYCRKLTDGNFEFVERKDDQVKIRGFKITPFETEENLKSHPYIKDAVVIAAGNGCNEKQLVAFYILKDTDIQLTNNDIRNYLRQSLVDYMIPANFVKLEHFPLTPNGKLDKSALIMPTLGEDKHVANSHIENELLEIWKESFGIDNIGINDNFFELGGHSLIAARLIAKIEKALGKAMQADSLYHSPTIKELALKLESSRNSFKNSSMNISKAQTNPILLSDFQLMFWISNLFEPKTNKINIIARKRLRGKIDISALNYAFNSLIKNHEILSYRALKITPAQFFNRVDAFQVLDFDLSNYPESEQEAILSQSLEELRLHRSWNKSKPMIEAKLFYLDADSSELQISVPHSAFDDRSEEILFSELSNAYLLYKNDVKQPALFNQFQFKDYVVWEREHLNQDLERDISFWERYFKDAQLVKFPYSVIAEDTQSNSYSSYIELPENIVDKLQNLITQHKINMSDILSATVALSLKDTVGDMNHDNIVINVIRSDRNNDYFEKMLGCFIHFETIKVALNSGLNLVNLAKVIQKSRIQLEPYQACSSMVKIACLNKAFPRKGIVNRLVNLTAKSYARLFKKSRLNPKMLAMYGRIGSLRTKDRFLINLNIRNNFLSSEPNKNLFGMENLKVKTHQYDLLNIDSILDFCLTKNESMDKAYLVISSNLKESVRNEIGREFIKILE